MPTPRNEYGFEQWWMNPMSPSYAEEPGVIAREAWHAAIDAIRAELASKGLWLAPMDADIDMLIACQRGVDTWEARYSAMKSYEAMRDSYLSLNQENKL